MNTDKIPIKNKSPFANQSQKVFALLIALFFVFLALGISIIHFSKQTTSEEYYKILGSKAMGLSVIAANNLNITDKEFAELKSIQYDKIQTNSANLRLQNSFKIENANSFSEIRRAYIITKLDNSPYKVTEENHAAFDYPIGTTLDSLLLCNVIVNEEEYALSNSDSNYHNNLNRYSHQNADLSEYYENESTGYFFSGNNGNDSVSGICPVYTLNGTFVGMLVVDAKIEGLSFYTNKMTFLITLLFIVPSLILCAIVVIIYSKYVKVYRESAYTDELTKLHNRTYFNHISTKIVGDCIRYKRPLSMIMIDIDYFKKFNDKYKHQEGDYIIAKVAKIIRSSARRSLDLAFRYGGDEFIIMLPDTDQQGAVSVAEDIQNAVRGLNIQHEDSERPEKIVTVTQGIYSGIPSCNTEFCIYQFIKGADDALYAAKLKGRNCYLTFHDARREELI